jgi:polysaccharide biosynthesis/export protein
MIHRSLVCCLMFTGVGVAGFGQALQAGPQNPQGAALAGQQTPQTANPGQFSNSVRPDYTLGSNDQILIRVPQSDEINERPFRVDTDGFINLPVVGRIRASGLTVQELEADLTMRLREFIREPLVSITVTTFRSEPVFVTGAFRTPGIYTLQGRRTLVEILTAAGGLGPNASHRIRVSRRAEYGSIELPNAVEDPEKKMSSVEISLESLTQNINPEEDIVLQPFDVVNVDRAERIYVIGEVGKVAAIELAERSTISVAQALTEAGGFTQYATRDKVRILRPILGTNRRAEIEIDLKRVFEGKDIDFPLLANDVLFVPRSSGKALLQPVGTSFLASIPYIIVSVLLRP